MDINTEMTDEEISDYRNNILPTLQIWEKAIINCARGFNIPCNEKCNYYYSMHNGHYCEL